MTASALKVAMIQDGTRRHYAVPMALHRAGALGCMFAEWFASPGSIESFLARCVGVLKPQSARRMRERFCPELSGSIIHRHPLLPLKLRRKRKHFDTDEAWYRFAAEQTGQWIKQVGFKGCNALYGYIRNTDPSVFLSAKSNGLRCVGDQMIAPAIIEQAERERQIKSFPGWENESAGHDLAIFDAMERATWQSLDKITCGSQYVADGLAQAGVEASRIKVIPYAPTGANLALIDRKSRPTITVGFLGAISLRKGAPYVLQLARRLASANVRFVMVGGTSLVEKRLEEFKPHVEIRPAVPRSQLPAVLGEFDMLLHPSTCEGCAMAVLEAMETGLPVIASPNSGTIIRDGETGFLCNYDDIDSMASRIEKLAIDATFCRDMGIAARKQIEQLDLDWYTRELLSLFG